MNDNIELQA